MNTDLVARSYSAVAPGYDSALVADGWMRRLLWHRYESLFASGQHVLDVGCGTGRDVCFLAERGVRVTGIDIAPGMIQRARERARERGLEDRLSLFVLSAEDVRVFPPGCFDGIISAFAALNTATDLHAFAGAAARLLRPGGHMVLHLLNRLGLWEILGLSRRGRLGEVHRRSRKTERTFLIGGKPVVHHVSFARPTYRDVFADVFALDAHYGLGCLRPPSNVTVPAPLTRFLDACEARVRGRWPFVHAGRFFVLEMTRRPRH